VAYRVIWRFNHRDRDHRPVPAGPAHLWTTRGAHPREAADAPRGSHLRDPRCVATIAARLPPGHCYRLDPQLGPWGWVSGSAPTVPRRPVLTGAKTDGWLRSFGYLGLDKRRAASRHLNEAAEQAGQKSVHLCRYNIIRAESREHSLGPYGDGPGSSSQSSPATSRTGSRAGRPTTTVPRSPGSRMRSSRPCGKPPPRPVDAACCSYPNLPVVRRLVGAGVDPPRADPFRDDLDPDGTEARGEPLAPPGWISARPRTDMPRGAHDGSVTRSSTTNATYGIASIWARYRRLWPRSVRSCAPISSTLDFDEYWAPVGSPALALDPAHRHPGRSAVRAGRGPTATGHLRLPPWLWQVPPGSRHYIPPPMAGAQPRQVHLRAGHRRHGR
jgi:hypothetical protein